MIFAIETNYTASPNGTFFRILIFCYGLCSKNRCFAHVMQWCIVHFLKQPQHKVFWNLQKCAIWEKNLYFWIGTMECRNIFLKKVLTLVLLLTIFICVFLEQIDLYEIVKVWNLLILYVRLNPTHTNFQHYYSLNQK